MLSWNEIVQNYITKHSDKIRSTTNPIRTRFGIEYFSYHKIDLKGNYTVLVDQPDWAEQYVERQIYASDPFLRHPSMYTSGITYVHNHGSEDYRELVTRSGQEVLEIDTSLMLIEKCQDYVEFFGFSTRSDNKYLSTLSLNKPHLLKAFAKYFKEQLSVPLKQMEEASSSLRVLKGSDYFTNEQISLSPVTMEELSFYKQLGLEEASHYELLSNREKQCLSLLADGYTTKEMAFALQLSPRTVESYLENIKNKLGCPNRKELFAIAKSLEDFQLIP